MNKLSTIKLPAHIQKKLWDAHFLGVVVGAATMIVLPVGAVIIKANLVNDPKKELTSFVQRTPEDQFKILTQGPKLNRGSISSLRSIRVECDELGTGHRYNIILKTGSLAEYLSATRPRFHCLASKPFVFAKASLANGE